MTRPSCEECAGHRSRLCGPTSVTEVRLDRGGYDRTGRYWGVGARLYVAVDESGTERHQRALSRASAVRVFRESNPHMKARA
jgi:hypothetical protein